MTVSYENEQSLDGGGRGAEMGWIEEREGVEERGGVAFRSLFLLLRITLRLVVKVYQVGNGPFPCTGNVRKRRVQLRR